MKFVTKPWGKEIWIADGSDTPYALKQIEFLAGMKSSLQVHKLKHETNYVISGEGSMVIGIDAIDIDRWLNASSIQEKVSIANEYAEASITIDLTAGVSVTVPPGYIHRVIAKSNLILVECSTTHLDDVYRLEDDSNRGHGKIDAEHQN